MFIYVLEKAEVCEHRMQIVIFTIWSVKISNILYSYKSTLVNSNNFQPARLCMH